MVSCQMYKNNDSTTCTITTTTNNDYVDYYNFATGEVGIQYVPKKTKIEIPKTKEQIRNKPRFVTNTNVQNKRVYRCQNRM